MCEDLGMSIPGSSISKCKGPEVGVCLACLRNGNVFLKQCGWIRAINREVGGDGEGEKSYKMEALVGHDKDFGSFST